MRGLSSPSYSLNAGIDLSKRRLYFGNLDYHNPDQELGSDFHFVSVQTMIRAIDKLIDMSTTQAIELHFMSYGGDPFEMLALLDKILESPVKFKFFGRGTICSAAIWILVVCDERYLAKNTNVMLHNGKDFFQGNNTDMEIYVEENLRLQTKLNEILVKNSYMPRSFWDMILRRDLNLTPEECLKLGLIDGIIKYKGRATLRKSIRNKTFKAIPAKDKMKTFLRELSKRVKMDFPKTLDLHLPEDKHEELEKYDNTEKELQNSGLEIPKLIVKENKE